jgi:hypothetical protein
VQGATLTYESGKAGTLSPSTAREERDCPFCAERILAKAKMCRFCGRDLSTIPAK